MTGSNRLAVVDRELRSGMIEGIDFGPRIWLLARSPARLLFWKYGHSFSLNGRAGYSEPALFLMRRGEGQSFRAYDRILEDGRFSLPRLQSVMVKLAEHFDREERASILKAAKGRKTLIIEDGGEKLREVYRRR